VGRDTYACSKSAPVVRFQSTRPRGARPANYAIGVAAELFQSTRPRGARREKWRLVSAILEFQSTRPRGARLAMHNGAGDEKQCFNPRARVGRDS